MKKATYYICFVFAAVGVAIYFGRQPWNAYQQERVRQKDAFEQMKKAETEREALIRQKSKYKSAAGREELLRESGYAKDGEVPLTAIK